MSTEKSFFDKFSPKGSFFMGFTSGIVLLIVIGFFVLLIMMLSGGGFTKKGLSGKPNTQPADEYAATSKFAECINSGRTAPLVQADYQEGVSIGVRGTPGTFINGQSIPGAVPYDQVKSVVDSILNGEVDDSAELVNVPINEDDFVYGDPDAPIAMVEYSDFECPYCSRFHPTAKQIVDDYPGQVKWIYKNFPLSSIHPSAQSAAEAAECAAEQGGNEAFWAYGDLLFQNQQALNKATYLKLAQQLGLE